jgi:bacillithiol biosynthesis cysteine-adding enzyme BshC
LVQHTISFEQSAFYSKQVIDYLKGKPELQPFYAYSPDLSGIKQCSENRTFGATQRKVLVDQLHAHYTQSGIQLHVTDKVHQQLEALNQSTTFTVTTGHQLCVLGGPLFVLAKAMHVIRLADELNAANDGKKYVPVFWLAGEDHDFDEIKSVHIAHSTLEWKIQANDTPVGRLPITGLNELLKHIPQATDSQLGQLMEKYTKDGNLAHATTRLLHYLFGEYGLVIINPDAAEFKRAHMPAMKADILRNTFWEAIQSTNSELSKQYRKLQVSGRAINHFYITPDNKRCLLTREGSYYSVAGTSLKFTASELEEEIHAHPDRFSPNVVMRPVYQETILPNIAYVGGPAEVSYWLQLRGVFEAAGVPMPVVLLRNSFILISAGDMRKLKKLRMGIEDFLPLSYTVLSKKLMDRFCPISVESMLMHSNQAFQQLIDELNQFDNKAGSMVLKDKLAFNNLWDKRIRDINNIRKTKLETQLAELYELYSVYYPDNKPAERYYNLTWYLRENFTMKQLTDLLYRFSRPISEGVTAVAF